MGSFSVFVLAQLHEDTLSQRTSRVIAIVVVMMVVIVALKVFRRFLRK